MLSEVSFSCPRTYLSSVLRLVTYTAVLKEQGEGEKWNLLMKNWRESKGFLLGMNIGIGRALFSGEMRGF